MKPTEQKRFDALYEQHLRGLKLHGYSASTIDVYSRAVRRLATYSMGLRLSETLALEVGDIDAETRRVHIRRGKGHKDRFVPLPDLTYLALQTLWVKHRHPQLLFPNTVGSADRIRTATTHMGRGGTQKAMRVLLAECGIKKRFPFIHCGTVLQPICWNAA